MIGSNALFGGTMVRTEADIKAKLEELRASQKKALEARMVWSLTDIGHQIKMLEWVLS